MNTMQRKELLMTEAKVEALLEVLTKLRNDEQARFDAMSDRTKKSIAGKRADEAIGHLGNAIDGLCLALDGMAAAQTAHLLSA